MASGRVTFFNEGKGVGAIAADDGGPDLRFERSRLQGVSTVAAGQRVLFEWIQGRTGPEASVVQPA